MVSAENAFLDWLRQTADPQPCLSVALGDDAAVWRLPSGEELVLCADALAEGSHFERDADPFLIGRKALAVNLSDLAAMGAAPLCALVTCALPSGFAPELPRRLVQGLRSLAKEAACPLVGGDTLSHAGGLVLSVSVLGRLLEGGPITRSGAEPDQSIVVTGRLGGSRRGRHLDFRPRLEEARQLVQWGPPAAMLDVSDGLLMDLHRLADASCVGFRLEAEALPIHQDAQAAPDPLRAALADGEDFELLFCVSDAGLARIRAHWQSELELTVIGRTLEAGRRVLATKKGEQDAPRWGHEHH